VAYFGVIGPYIFEDDKGVTVTVTSDCCTEMSRNFRVPELGWHGLDLQTLWFQQDGATAHTARNSMNVLWQMLPAHIILQNRDVQWPARSDLFAYDYFLWGYLKSKVYINRPWK
jgi:hypothetical protein